MVSYIVRGRSEAASARLLSLQNGEVACVSVIAEAEIRYGLARRPEATTLQILMNEFLSSIPVLPWSRGEADTYGRVKAGLEKRGVSLGNMDMMIAAHAIATRAVLVTNDKAFSHVDELPDIVNWATDL